MKLIIYGLALLCTVVLSEAQLIGPTSPFEVSGGIVSLWSSSISGTVLGQTFDFTIPQLTRSNLIIATVAFDSNSSLVRVDLITDTFSGSSYSLPINVNNKIGTTAATVSCAIASGLALSNGPNSVIRFGFNGTVAALAVSAREVVGVATFDQFSTNSGTGTAPTSNVSSLRTTANEFSIGCIAIEGPNTDAPGTWDNLRKGERAGTNSGGAASNCTIEEGFLELVTIGTSVAKKTGITSRDWAAAVATYKIR